MKTLTFLLAMFFATAAWAWGPGWGPGWGSGYYPGWGGMGYGYYGGGYGMYGMGVIQTPSFNYTTTIVQSPPIIVNQTGESLPRYPDRGDRRYPASPGYPGDGR